MKTISTDLNTHIQQSVTTLAWCLRIERVDGVKFYFTTHDVDIPFGGQIYKALTGFTSSSVSNKSDLTVDDLSMLGIFDDESITLPDLRAGLFDYASVFLFFLNWTDTTQGALNMRRGFFGEAVSSPQGWFQIELRGLNQLLQQNILEEYGPACRADLGDSRCTKPIDPPLWQALTTYKTVVNMLNNGCWVKAVVNANSDYTKYGNVIFECTTAGESGATAPAWDTTIGHTTADGSVVWTTRAAWTSAAHVDTVTDGSNFSVVIDAAAGNSTLSDVTWLVYGQVQWLSGLNVGKAVEIKTWGGSGSPTIQTVLPSGYVPSPGDTMALTPGCNKTLTHCRDKFANLFNKRSEDYLPGDDKAFTYAQ